MRRRLVPACRQRQVITSGEKKKLRETVSGSFEKE